MVDVAGCVAERIIPLFRVVVPAKKEVSAVRFVVEAFGSVVNWLALSATTVLADPVEDVATLVSSLPELTKARFPMVHGDVVEIPSKAIVPDVVIVPPVTGHVVAIEETVAFDVLQVEHVTAFVLPV